MDIELQHTNEAIITRYTDQPVRLPAELRRAIEERWDGAPVQLYALADLESGAVAGRDLGGARPEPPRDRAQERRAVGHRERVALARGGGARGAGPLRHDAHDPGASRRSGAARGALHAPPAARVREPPVRARGGDRGARHRRRPTRTASTPTRVARPDPRRAGAGGGAASRGDPATARLPHAVPAAADARHERRRRSSRW